MTTQQQNITRERVAELEGGVAGLQAEHDVTKQELIQTLDELVHRADLPERSKQAARDVMARTQNRAARAARGVGTRSRILGIVTVFAASGVIGYALSRKKMLRARRRTFTARHPLRRRTFTARRLLRALLR